MSKKPYRPGLKTVYIPERSASWNGLTGLPVFSLKTASEFYWIRSMKVPGK
jgi:hypothetical protein